MKIAAKIFSTIFLTKETISSIQLIKSPKFNILINSTDDFLFVFRELSIIYNF